MNAKNETAGKSGVLKGSAINRIIEIKFLNQYLSTFGPLNFINHQVKMQLEEHLQQLCCFVEIDAATFHFV